MNVVDYVAAKISSPITIDGDISKDVWAKADWSKRFIDMVDGGPAIYNTQSAILWNDEFLYIAFDAEEPFLSAHQTVRDSIIFLENDLEVFIDGGDCYYELEVNALNTIYEILFAWKDTFLSGITSGKYDSEIFNVHSPATFTFAGDYDRTGATFWEGTHPRGARWAFRNFDLPGLQTAVNLRGSLNDDSDIDDGWSLEIAIPWQSLELLANGRSVPPVEGDIWSIFLGRFQKLVVGGKEVQPHPASAFNSHGIYDTHQPDKWSKILFSSREI